MRSVRETRREVVVKALEGLSVAESFANFAEAERYEEMRDRGRTLAAWRYNVPLAHHGLSVVHVMKWLKKDRKGRWHHSVRHELFQFDAERNAVLFKLNFF